MISSTSMKSPIIEVIQNVRSGTSMQMYARKYMESNGASGQCNTNGAGDQRTGMGRISEMATKGYNEVVSKGYGLGACCR